MKVIVINGRGGAGKDTFVNMCRKYAKVMSVSSVDDIKTAAKLLGWEGKKELSDRKFLSDLKDLSTQYNDGPMKSLKEAYDTYNTSGFDILFMHVREPLEIMRCKKEFDAITLLIRRPGGNTYGNHADDDVEDFAYDWIVENDGTLIGLDIKAMIFCNDLRIGIIHGII